SIRVGRDRWVARRHAMIPAGADKPPQPPSAPSSGAEPNAAPHAADMPRVRPAFDRATGDLHAFSAARRPGKAPALDGRGQTGLAALATNELLPASPATASALPFRCGTVAAGPANDPFRDASARREPGTTQGEVA